MFSLRTKVLPLLALIAVLAGCSAEAGPTAGAGSSANEVATAAASDTAPSNTNNNSTKENHFGGHRGFGGPDSMLVGAALHSKDINLTSDQKTAIETAMKANRPAKPAFDATRAKTLANEIRTNTFDTTVAAAKPANVNESAHAARIAASANVLQTLHDTLTADQRVALVNSINQHSADHMKKVGEMKADGTSGAQEHARGAREGEMHGEMLANLNLTQAQKDDLKAKFAAQRPAKPSADQIEAMKAQFATMRTEMQTKLESFKSDSFNATTFVTPSTSIKIMHPQEAHANRLAIITSVLTPAQREQLAARIEAGPSAMKPVRPVTTTPITAPINQ